ncbi:MAG: SDR family NAD(P)-dependent oxidoreductase, partial [Verrucomicrobiota bacterium]|nr:SDR family NAD(P)-dependent oxidoreductase [Verrucomicrobiota bacterium]
MACHFPDAPDYGQFWENISSGLSSIRCVPRDRWTDFTPTDLEKSSSVIPWCGILEDIKRFDHAFFNITPREARSMDPQQRLLLHETWHCIEDAGVTLRELRAQPCGVWVGVMANDYHQSAVASDVEIDSYAALGSYDCILANRISYNLGLSGPSLSVGAACASSSVALHLAKQSLLSGECKYAIAAGVNLNFHPWKNTSFARSHMLSPDGRCKTFDQSANGYVPGEGIAVLLLQPFEDALKAGNAIHGLIAGTAVNHTGFGPMITAPRVEAQAEVIRAAMADAGISPAAISYLEAHGTGTSLGDPIEVAGMQAAFRSVDLPSGSCHIGSVKTNIGHLEAASGLAGVIKTLLMIRHGVIVPTLNIETSNGLIDFQNSPFVPAKEIRPWKSSNIRRAGVSSFGFGGANSHIVLEEYVAPKVSKTKDGIHGSMPFILSAKTPDALQRLLDQWITFIDSDETGIGDLKDVCRTLLVGRECFSFRSGGMVRNWDDVRRILKAKKYRRPQSGPAPWSLVIGEFRCHGIEDVRRYFESVPGFLNRVCKFLAQIETQGKPDLVAGFRKETWDSKRKAYYDLGLAMGVVEILMESGVKLGEISGAQGGFCQALAASGCLSDDEIVSTVSTGRATLTRRPKLTYLDLATGNRIRPVEAQAKYLEVLAGFEPEKNELRNLLETSRQLLDHQLTFKKYFDAWSEVGLKYGYDLPAMLKDPVKSNGKQNQIITVACLHSLTRLREKWELPQLESVSRPELREIVALLEKDLLKPEEMLELVAGVEDIQKLTLLFNQRLLGLQSVESLPLLNEMSKVPHHKVNQIQMDQVPIGLEKGDRVVGIGDVGGSLTPTVSFQINEKSSFIAHLLELWLSDTEVDWQCFIQGVSSVKQRLPGYPFKGKHFWLKRNSADGSEKLRETPIKVSLDAESRRTFTKGQPIIDDHHIQALSMVGRLHKGKRCFVQGKTPLKVSLDAESRWTFTKGQPIIDDHHIAGQCLLPGAAMVDLGIASFKKVEMSRFFQIDDFRILNPCAVRETCVVESRVSEDAFELLVDKQVLSTGRISTTSKEPPRETIAGISGSDSTTASQLYDKLAKLGYRYGPSLRSLSRIENCEPFWIKLEEESCDWSDGRRLSPRLLDGVFQGGVLTLIRRGAILPGNSLWVPCGFASCNVRARIHGPVYVRETQYHVLPSGDAIISLLGVSQEGEVQVVLKGLILKVVPSNFAQLDPVSETVSRFVPEWQVQTTLGRKDRAGKALVIDGFNGPGPVFDGIHAETFKLDYLGHEDWPRALEETLCGDNEISRIYWIPPRFDCPDDDEDLNVQVDFHVMPFLKCCQVLAACMGRSFELVVLTESIVDLDRDIIVDFPLHALIHGIAKTLAREHEHCHILCVDLETGWPRDQLYHVAETSYFDAVGECCWRGKSEYRKGLKADPSVVTPASRFHQNDVFVIAGGLGGVGRELAAFLHNKYKGRLVLLGRNRPSKAQVDFLEELRESDADIRYMRCDVANEHAVNQVLKDTVREFGRINGIFHVAGSLMDSLLLKMKPIHFQQGIQAKVNGAFNLYRAAAELEHPLQAFVQFSSALTLEGNSGQASYVAACCFQDQYSAYLRGCQVPAQVINWGRWEEAGSVTREYHRSVLEGLGILGIKTAEALAELEGFIDGKMKQSIVARYAEWKRKEVTERNGERPFTEASTPSKSKPIRKQNGDPRAEVLKVLQGCINDVLESEVIEVDSVLKEQGVDSIMGAEFVTEVNMALDIGLNAFALYDYPTLNRLATHILEEYDIAASDGVSDPVAKKQEIPSTPSVLARRPETEYQSMSFRDDHDQGDDIAIIGMAARFPNADSIDEFWENLRSGKNCIREVPEDYWTGEWFSPDPEARNRSVCKWGGFLRDSDRFDSLFFKISPADAAWMDPQQRIVLEECWRAFENAGYTPEKLSESRCGVMIGVMSNDYQEMLSSDPDRTLQAAELVGNSNAILSSRISYFLNLRGPSMALDTACSSSLVALHYASNALRNGEAEMMVVGGVTLYQSPMYYVRMSKAGMLSPSGRCWSFDERADGYVPGEGCGVVVLKRVRDALRDGDHIHAVIKGSALNQDGKTNGITAPSSESQKDLLLDVYSRSGINPQSLGLLEAHGTGTILGDPIEFNALT